MTTACDPTLLPAIVLAGGNSTAEFCAEAGTSVRALADINGLPMVAYVIRALRASALVGRIILVAPDAVADESGADEFVRACGDLAENVARGLASCGSADCALLISADVPFITPDAIDDFIRRSAETGADCCYAGVTLDACRRQFPAMRRTAINAGGTRVTGGNAVYQRVAAFERERAVLQEAHRRRKNPLFLAGLIGPLTIARLVIGRLSIPDIERAASRAMGVSCRVILTAHAEIGTDIDRPEDLRRAREILRP